MTRFSALLVGLIGGAGVLAILSSSASPGGAKPDEEKQPATVIPAPVKPVVAEVPKPSRPTVAVFNMAAVMSEFQFAKYHVWRLRNKQIELSKQLMSLRAESTKIQTALKRNPNHPRKEDLNDQMRELARKIEDEERKINKQLNEDADYILGEIHDRIQVVADKAATISDYHVVLSYCDAVTPSERKKVSNKERRLKQLAVTSFYVDPKADITPVIAKTLNMWYPAMDSMGKPVDTSKLQLLPQDEKTPAPAPAVLRVQELPGLMTFRPQDQELPGMQVPEFPVPVQP